MGLLGGPADRQRPPRRPTTSSRACSRTSTRATRRCAATTSSARAAGTATACRSRSRSSSSSGIDNKHEIEAYGIAEFNQRCRESVFEFLEDWNALTERIGFWIDLDDAYRTLDATLHRVRLVGAAPDLRDKGLLYEGHKVVPYCPGCGTALLQPRGRARLRGRRRPERLRPPARSSRTAVRCRPATSCSSGPRRRGRWSPTRRSPSTPSSPTCARRRAPLEAPVVLAEALVERVLGAEGVRILDRFPGAALDGVRYEPPFGYIKADAYGERGHTRPARRLRDRRRRHRPRAHRDRLRRGRLPPRRAVRAERRQPGAPRRHLRRAHRPLRRAQRQGRRPRPDRGPARARAAAAGRDATSTPTRTAGAAATRSSTTPSASWYIATSKLRDRLLAANDEVDWHPEHISEGRMGDWLRGNVDWALSRERYWGTPLPVWRCTSDGEHIHVIGSLRRARGALAACAWRTRTGRSSTRSASRARTAARAMERVPEVIDVWFDSGCDALRPGPRAVRERGALRGALPGELRLRGARPDARLVLLAAGRQRAALRSLALRERRLPRASSSTARARRCRSPRATSSCPGTSSTASAPTPSAGTSSPPSSRGTATASTSTTIGESVRLFLRQLWNTYAFLDHLRARARGRADRPRPLDPVAAERDGRARSPSAWTRSTRRSPAGRSPTSSTTSPTGTCAARGGASGRATARPSPRCRRRS